MSRRRRDARCRRSSSSSARAAARCRCCRSRDPRGQGLRRLPGERHLAALRRRRRSATATMPRSTARRPSARRRCRCRTSTRASSTASRSLLFGPYAGFSTQVPQARLAARPFPLNRTRQHPADAGRGAREFRADRISDRPDPADSRSISSRRCSSSSRRRSARTGSRRSPASGCRSSSPTKTTPACSNSAPSWSPPQTARWSPCSAPRPAHRPPHSSRSGAAELLRERADRRRLAARLKSIIPTYGIDLKQDVAACRDIRARTAKVLGIEQQPSAATPSLQTAGARG